MGNLLKSFFKYGGFLWVAFSFLVYFAAMFAPSDDSSADIAIVAILIFWIGIVLIIIGVKLPKSKIISEDGGNNTKSNISFTNPRILDESENELTNAETNQQIQITADATNGNKFPQDFAFYVNVRDTGPEAWITGSLSSSQSFSPALSWVPNNAGTFTFDISLFDNIENKNELAESLTLQITIIKEEHDELNSTLGNESSESTDNENNDDEPESQGSAKWV